MASSAFSHPAALSEASRGLRAVAEPTGTSELVLEAAHLAEELFRLEATLAKDEVMADLRALRTSAFALGVALLAFGFGVALMLLAAVWIGGPIVALLLGLALVMVAVVAAVVGRVFVPDRPLEATLRRVQLIRAQLKGHLS